MIIGLTSGLASLREEFEKEKEEALAEKDMIIDGLVASFPLLHFDQFVSDCRPS